MDPRNAKQAAAAMLAKPGCNAKNLALTYAGVVVLFSLLCTGISYGLGIAADNTSGLSGLALRSMYQSGQTVISLASNILILLWQFGLISVAVGYARGQRMYSSNLWDGFQCWGRILRMSLLLMIVALGVFMACTYIATFLFTLSPLSDSLYLKMESLHINGASTELTDELMAQLIPYMGWMFVFFGILLLVIGLPTLYRFRLCEFALMDDAAGARDAIRISKLLSQGNRFGMFRLDLSFWWFYLLQVLSIAVGYLDVILPAAGVKLPIHQDVAMWIAFCLSLGLQFLITWRFAVPYQTAFAVYYDRLKEDRLPKKPETPPNVW